MATLKRIKELKETWKASEYWTANEYLEWYKSLTIEEKNIVDIWDNEKSTKK